LTGSVEICSNVKEVHDKGANVYSIVHKIDTDTLAGKIMLFNFSLFAEMEATLRRERQQAGIAIARTQGRALGRRKGMSDKTLSKAGLVRQMYLSPNPVYSVSQITKELKISKKTLYKCLEHFKHQTSRRILTFRPLKI
jgi:DNA invertase Pin-like site-specific DNA recombinase